MFMRLLSAFISTKSDSPTLVGRKILSESTLRDQGALVRIAEYFRDFDNLVKELEKDTVTRKTMRRIQPLRCFDPHGLGYTSVVYTHDNDPPPYTYSEDTVRGVYQPASLLGREETTTEYHPNWQRRLNASRDVGGPFRSFKQYAEMLGGANGISGSRRLSSRVTTGFRYTGVVLAHSGPFTFPPSAESTDSVLNAWGAKEIAQMKPTNSVADLSTTLIEIYREGLPKMIGASTWKSRSDELAKAGADDFLNFEFGWKPLVSEVTDVMTGITRFNDLIDQFNRDSGKVVRRRRVYEPEVSESDSTIVSGVARPGSPWSTALMYKDPIPFTAKVVRRRVTSKQRWISCAFTYHSNLLGDSEGNTPYDLNRFKVYNERARHLLGVEITPSVVYNLVPWSWAVDWFSSLGDVISNLDDYQKYGLVMPYGYVMEHSFVQDTYYHVGPSSWLNEVRGTPVRLTTEVKKRVRANPFGFGLTWDVLDNTQRAILAALGISKRGK